MNTSMIIPPVPLLYDDHELLAVSKPAGRLVIPGRGADEGLSLAEELSLFAGRKLYVVHRLDKEVSGALVFAKTAEAHRALSALFEKRETVKTYSAWVRGEMAENEGLVDRPLRAFGSGRMGVDARGKPSLTRYRVLERRDGATRLEVSPETGRRHQIRVHLYAIGHPILGETRYGSDFPVGGASRLLLHAHRLRFRWRSGEERDFISPLPADFNPPPRSFSSTRG